MEFTLTIKMDLERLRELRKAQGVRAEAMAHAKFLEDSLAMIVEELEGHGVHPEVLEEALGMLKTDITSYRKASS